MCGIFGYIGAQQDAPQMTLAGLKLLEYRGYDSWGIAFEYRKHVKTVKHVGKIGDAEISKNVRSNWALGHTRWATHGGVTKKNAHPHLDCTGSLIVVHNGIVENFAELKKTILHHTLVSQTDSEVIAHLIEEELVSTPFVAAVKKVFSQLTGLNALIVFSLATHEMAIVKKGTPLVVAKNAHGFFVASDAIALVDHVKDVYYLVDDDVVVFNTDSLQCTKVGSDAMKKMSFVPLSLTKATLSKRGRASFLEKEIYEQPETLRRFVAQSKKEISQLAQFVNKSPLAFAGCGSAYHASLFTKYLFSSHLHRSAQVFIGSEFTHFIDALTVGTSVVFLSQSGETIDIVEHAQTLKKNHQKIACFVNRESSTLDRLSDFPVHLTVGPEQSVLATKSFTAKLLAAILLVARLSKNQKGILADIEETIVQLGDILRPEYVGTYIVPVAKMLIRKKNGFIIGKGKTFPLALESALKIKEVTYLHYEGLPGGELKHGTIALIEKQTPCIVYAPHDETFEHLISNAIELKSRGAIIIGISSQSHEAFDYHIPIGEHGDSTAVLHAVIGQLLALHMAYELGNDPDKPRNLAKSVTVR